MDRRTAPIRYYSALTFQGAVAPGADQLAAGSCQQPAQPLALIQHTGRRSGVGRVLMTNLGGHCMASVLEAFGANATTMNGRCVSSVIRSRGYGLPLAGHKDNHAGLMTPGQMAQFKAANNIVDGDEWSKTAGLNWSERELGEILGRVPFNAKGTRRQSAPQIPVDTLALPEIKGAMSTQQGFGLILQEVARSETALAERIVTTSPDVTVSTNLGPWVNRRGVFAHEKVEDVFQSRKLMSAQRWHMGPNGQHIELGIAENNLFILLAALGLSHHVFGERLIPIGTLYDPFIARGLDALNYACYQDARFILVATPSGISLAPEGGAHQSVGTPLIGMAQDGIASFEPAYVDELAAILQWAFEYIQREAGTASADDWLHEREGGSVYLRLSTRSLDQPIRPMTNQLRDGIIDGGYWLREPAEGTSLAIAYQGTIADQAALAMGDLLTRFPGAGLLAVTSADRLNAGWTAAQSAQQHGKPETSYVERLLEPLDRGAQIITVIDGHPATLSWLGAVHGHKVQALGVEHFGQTGTVGELYAEYRIDKAAIVEAALATIPKIKRA